MQRRAGVVDPSTARRRSAEWTEQRALSHYWGPKNRYDTRYAIEV